MATGQQRTNFAVKRLLTKQRFDETFFQYLDQKLLDVSTRIWGGNRGIFGTVNLAADGNDKFKLTPLPTDALDGDGEILIFEAGIAGETEGIQFENANGVVYFVGARYVGVPALVVRNPRNALIDYDTIEDQVGETADPNSVVEGAGILTLVVDSIFEPGVSHAGRLVTVFLKVPLSDVESVAIERDLVVTWDGSNNKVVTTGLLGQGSGGASVIPSDYTVVAQGITVRRNTDLSVTDPYAFVGTVTGAGAGNPPAVFSTAGQINVSGGINDSLQSAYGNGNVISVTGDAVTLKQSVSMLDPMRGLLRIDQLDGANADVMGSQSIAGATGTPGAPVHDHVAGLNLVVWHDAFLQKNEPVSLGSGGSNDQVLILQTGASAGQAQSAGVSTFDFVLLDGFSASLDKLYRVSAVNSQTDVRVVNLDGTNPGFNGETGGTAYFLRAVAQFQDKDGPSSLAGSAIFLPSSVSGVIGPHRFPSADPDNSNPIVTGDFLHIGDPALLRNITCNITGKRLLVIHGDLTELVLGAPADATSAAALTVGKVGANPTAGIVKPDLGRWRSYKGHDFLGMSSKGRLDQPARVFDDFVYPSARYGIGSTQLPLWVQDQTGSTGSITGNVSAATDGQSLVSVASGTGANNRAYLLGGEALRFSGSPDFRDLYFYAKARVYQSQYARLGLIREHNTANEVFVGFENRNGDIYVIVQTNLVDDDATDTTINAPAGSVIDGNVLEFYFHMKNSGGANLWSVEWWLTGAAASMTTFNVSRAKPTGNWGAFIEGRESPIASQSGEIDVDIIEAWDDELKEA